MALMARVGLKDNERTLLPAHPYIEEAVADTSTYRRGCCRRIHIQKRLLPAHPHIEEAVADTSTYGRGCCRHGAGLIVAVAVAVGAGRFHWAAVTEQAVSDEAKLL